jgi:regulator of sigma E protease
MLLPVVDSVAAGSAAEAAGFQPGDLIVSIDGTKVDSFEELQRITQTASDTELVVTVDRGGNLTELVATPRRHDVVTTVGTTRVSILGVQSKDKPEYWHIYSIIILSTRLSSRDWRLGMSSGGPAAISKA